MSETTWQSIRDQIEFCKGDRIGEYSYNAPAPACDAARKWIDFLEAIGAAFPKLLPTNDAMILTWNSAGKKIYLTIVSEDNVDLHHGLSLNEGDPHA